MLLDIIIALTIASLLLLVMLHIFALVQLAQRKEVNGNLPLNHLRQEPEGVEKIIVREDGTRLRVLHKGSGPAVLLIHDIGVSMVTMNQLYRMLAGYGFQVIAYDMRGHGSSTLGSEGMGYEQLTADLKAVIDTFQLKEMILVGHSVGAALAVRLSLSYGDQFRRKIKGIVSISGFDENSFLGMLKGAFLMSLLKLGFISRLLKTRFYSDIFAAFYFGGVPDPASVKAFMEIYNAQPLHRLLPLLHENPIDARLEEKLKELHIPCTCIWSPDNAVGSAQKIRRWKRFLPQLQLACITGGTGHMMVWECPGKLVDFIRMMDKGLAISAD